MKYMKRSKIYQASNYNVTFDPAKVEAHSYQWWKFVSKVEGKVVFNDYRYSNTTSKHQSKVRRIMEELNIKIDLSLPLAKGINSTNLQEVITEGEETLCNQFLAQEARALCRS